jgi:thiol-disulfide isomerase/thioredoxin
MNKIIFVAIFLTGLAYQVCAQNQFARISGTVDQIKSGDSVTIFTSKYGYVISEPLVEGKNYRVAIINHHFNFKIPIAISPLSIELKFSGKHQIEVLKGYFIEKNDNIAIHVDSTGYTFSGDGAEKFKVGYSLYKIRENDFQGIGTDLTHPSGLSNVQAKTEKSIRHQIAYLNSHKAYLGHNAFTLLMANIYGFSLGEVSSTYYYHFLGLGDSLRNIALNSIRKTHVSEEILMPDKNFLSDKILKYSGSYSSGVILKYQVDSCYLNKKPFLFKDCYDYITHHFTGALRERILTNLFFYYKDGKQDIAASLIDALTIIKEPDFVHILKDIQMSNAKGATAFDFTLPDVHDIRHSLKQYKGKVILIDFWYTGCGNCVRLSPYLKKVDEKFDNRSVIFLSINVDHYRYQWLEGIRSGKYSSENAINLYTEGAGLKHALCMHYQIKGCPTLLLIDKKGKLMQSPIDPRDDDGKDLSDLINRELLNE